MRKALAVVTGGDRGNLGPILRDMIKDIGYEVFCPGLPEWDFTRQDIAQHIDDLGKFTIEKYGVPHILVLNAAIDNPPSSKAELFPYNDDIIRVNYIANKHICRVFWEEMKKLHGIKHIIFIGSILGNVAADYRNYDGTFDKPVDYGASKRACMSLVQNLAVRGARNNILVNQLSFGPYDNGKHNKEFYNKIVKNIPMGRMLKESDIRKAITGVILQSAMTGQQILVDCGYTAW